MGTLKFEKTVEINTEAAECIIRHMQCFRDQCSNKKVADFGEPCTNCRYAETCEFDWFAHIKPVSDIAVTKFQLHIKQDTK